MEYRPRSFKNFPTPVAILKDIPYNFLMNKINFSNSFIANRFPCFLRRIFSPIFPVLLLFICLLVVSPCLSAQETERGWEYVRLSDTLYELRISAGGYFDKVLASIGPDGVLLMESGPREDANDLLQAITDLGGGKPKIIINSHSHQEHLSGNQIIGKDILIIGHARLRQKLMEGVKLFYGYDESSIPKLTFTKDLSLYFNGEEIKMKAFPGAHDDCDIVVWFTKSKVAFTGALVTACKFPSLDQKGDVLKYPAISRLVLDWLPADVRIVPGHGEDGTMAQGQQFVDMLEKTIEQVRQALAQGKTLEVMQKEDLFKEWVSWEVSYVKRNDWIQYIYEGLTRKTPPDPPKKSIYEPLFYAWKEKGPQGVVPVYDDIKTNHAGEYDIDEYTMFKIGNLLYKAEKVQDAVPFLELSLRDYPKMGYAGVINRFLGFAYHQAGDKSKAIAYYRKALEINSKDTKAIDALKELEGKK